MRCNTRDTLPFLGSALLALALAGQANAQDRTGSVEITPFGGADFGGRLYAGSNAIFSRDVDVDTSGTYGVRVGGNINRWFGLEASFSTAKGNIKGRDSGGGLFSSSNKLGELDVKRYELNGVFNFGRRQVIPYFTLGAGATTFKASVPGFDASSDTRFSANLGLGVKIFFNPHVGLRFDGRGRAAYINDSTCSRDYVGYCYDDHYDHNNQDRNRWYTSGELTGGLTVAF